MALCFGRARMFLPLLLALIVLFALPTASLPPTAAQPASRSFPETGHTVSGSFLSYWQAHGGLAQQGYPISDPLSETSETDGQLYTVQYFERAVLEAHPENSGTPFEVLPSLLGVYRYREYYGPDGAPNQHAPSDAPRYFLQTGHTLGGPFRRYWEAHGGLAQQGYPISDEFIEVSDLDNKPYTVQYFERAAFELHPEHAGTPYEVLLTQLGTYQQRARYGTLIPPPPSEKGLSQVRLVGSNTYLAWTEVIASKEHKNHSLYAVDVRNSRPSNLITVSQTFDFTFYSLSGSTIVWTNDRGNALGEDLDTGITFTIASGVLFPTISGRTVAWLDGIHVITKDLDTNTTSIVGSAQTYSLYVAVSDEYLAWTESKGSNTVCNARALNRKTGQIQTVAHQMVGQCIFGGTSVLSGHYLVWADDGKPTLLINLKTGETMTLPGGKGFKAAIRGNTVIWDTYDDMYVKGEIWGMKLTDRIPRLLLRELDGGYGWFTIAGDWLIAQDETDLTPHRLADLFPPVHR